MSIDVLGGVSLAVGATLLLGSVAIPGWLAWRTRAWAWRVFWLAVLGVGLWWASFFAASFYCGVYGDSTCGGGGRIISVVDAPGTWLLRGRRYVLGYPIVPKSVLGYPKVPSLLAPRMRLDDGV